MYIDVKIHGEICCLYLNKPGTNSLDHQMLDQLYDKVFWVSQQSTIKVVILKSNIAFGFSSGLDIRNFINSPKTLFAEKVYYSVAKTFQIIKTIVQSPQIFICALSGPVIGSAVSIVLGCDFRIAARGTWFWLPDVQYGGLLADGSIELMTKIVGISRTSMLIQTNERVNLDDADKWGLIYKTVELQKLDEAAFSFAKKLCILSFKTLSIHKKMINEGLLNYFRSKQLKEILYSEETYQRLQTYVQNWRN